MVCVTVRHQRGQGRLPHAKHGTVGAAKVETSMLSGARRLPTASRDFISGFATKRVARK